MAYAKALREQLGRIGADINKILDKAASENNRGLASDEREQFHALETEYTQIEDSIEAAEKGEDIRAKLARVSSGGKINEAALEELRSEFRISPAAARRKADENNPHAKAFANYLRQGAGKLSVEDSQVLTTISSALPADVRNAMSTTTGSQGGYIVPTSFSNMLEVAKKWFGGIEGTVEKFTTGEGNSFPWPSVNDTANRGRIVGQNVGVSNTDLVFGQVVFSAYIGSSDLVLIPLALIQDSYFDLEALCAKLLGTRLGRLFNWKCTVGTGTNEPTGIVPAAVAAGNVVTLATGNVASIAYSNLVDVQHAVDPAYRENPSSRWMFSDTMLKLLKKLVDGSSRPLWQPGLTASFGDGASVTGSKPKILGNEYIVNTDMAIPAANAYSLLFGDLSTFKVREVAGGTTLMVLRERYAENLQVGYTAFQRFDSNLVDGGTHPIAVMQQSAT